MLSGGGASNAYDNYLLDVALTPVPFYDGSGAGTRVTAYHGSTEAFRFDAFPGTVGGVFVG